MTSCAWQLHGIPIIATVNDERCLTFLDDALRLAPLSGAASGGLQVEVEVYPEWTPPTWIGRISRLWSQGRYHLCRIDGDPVVLYDGVAWGRLLTAERRIVIGGLAQIAEDKFLLSQPLFMALLPAALGQCGLLPLHACAVDWDGQAIILPATSGSGKSTLALALLRGGFKLLSDDMPILQRQADGSFRLLPFPERSRVLPSSLDFFPDLAGVRDWAEPSGTKLLFDPAEVFGDCYAQESKPTVIVLPRIAHAPVSTLCPVAPSAALTAIMAGMAFGSTGDSMGAHLPTLIDFVASCRTYALDTGTDFDRLPAMLRRLLDEA